MPWALAYDGTRDGFSFITFYKKLKDLENSLLVIKDKNGSVFGAFIDDKWDITNDHTYNGSYNCFVFKIVTTFMQKNKVKVYRSSALNDYFMVKDENSLTVGEAYVIFVIRIQYIENILILLVDQQLYILIKICYMGSLINPKHLTMIY